MESAAAAAAQLYCTHAAGQFGVSEVDSGMSQWTSGRIQAVQSHIPDGYCRQRALLLLVLLLPLQVLLPTSR